MKICSKCKIEKDDDEFGKNGKNRQCKVCVREYYKEYRKNNKDKIAISSKKYIEKNKLKILEYNRKYKRKNKNEIIEYNRRYRENHKDKALEYYINNKENILEYHRQYNIDNIDKIHELQKIYYTNNRDKLLENVKKYRVNNRDKIRKRNRNRINTDIVFKLRHDIGTFILNALKKQNSSKQGLSCMQFLDYDIPTLKKHIESQFEPWMNWDNQGKYTVDTWDDNDSSTWKWQIDHIIPQSKLPYTSMADDNFKKCWALNNLRPLSAKQNIIDGNRR